MNKEGWQRTIRLADSGEGAGWAVEIIDQTKLPFVFEIATLTHMDEAAHAISSMQVRGAPLIGVTAAYGMALAMNRDSSGAAIEAAYDELLSTRPTAVNLKWALDRMKAALLPIGHNARRAEAYRLAGEMAEEDAALCSAIGDHGLKLLQEIAARKGGEPVQVLTHCNAGALATIDWGTATAPIYKAQAAGLPVHVWVDETRPRNQGASLTAWELGEHAVPHTVIADNAGGHLMQHGQVDLCIVGSDRTTEAGDVCNKIGTYLKALAAKDNDVPFYVALPSSTIDWAIEDGLTDIPIEERAAEEVSEIAGLTADGAVTRVRVMPPASPAANPAFDVTPARLVTGLITERGIAEASTEGLAEMFPEKTKGQSGLSGRPFDW